jgi:hypothetical protein
MSSDPKRAEASEPASEVTSYIRRHDAEDIDIPANPLSSAAALIAAVDVCEEFLERWLARHFSLSVKLHDVQRRVAADEPQETRAEVSAILGELCLVQGVLIELHEYATGEEPLRALMREGRLLQNGVIALYTWLDETLDALAARSVKRRGASFVDGGEGSPPSAIVRTLERLHPDLERLVQIDGIPTEREVATKLALCFRQIGATVVRISGRSGTLPPPSHAH